MLTITLNGSPASFEDGTTLDEVVRSLGHDPTRSGVAAAVDGAVVRRATWPDHEVVDGVHVEVLTAVQGGA